MAAGEAYDPARPNEYEAAARTETARREAQVWERKEAARVAAIARTKEASLSLSAEEAFARRMAMSKEMGSETAAALEASLREEEEAAQKIANETNPKLTFAERMLRKQGWQGGGLGRRGEGVATPLEVVPISRTHGVIAPAVEGAAAGKAAGGSRGPRKKGQTKLQGNPSRVVFLRNLVGPGEVDGGLRVCAFFSFFFFFFCVFFFGKRSRNKNPSPQLPSTPPSTPARHRERWLQSAGSTAM